MSFYETDRALGEYLLFHYGRPEEILPYPFGPVDALEFPVRCVSACVDPSLVPEGARALDVGCAVGRSSFELARLCEEVIGVDASEGFVEAARTLQRDGYLGYAYTEEGDLRARATAEVPTEIDRRRVSFRVGNAEALPRDLGEFDVVLLANLVDRLGEPSRCLGQLPGLVKPGGLLIITSPYTWLEDYTVKSNWLGGYEKNGGAVRSSDALHDRLSSSFELIGRKDLPFLIREHARKFQWSVAEASSWRRRAPA